MLRSLHLIVVLAIVLTAQIVGTARGQARVAGQLVICSGGAAVVVSVDAQGKPTGPAHFCPDCVTNLVLAHAQPAVAISRSLGVGSAVWRGKYVASQGPQSVTEPVARGPPLFDVV